MRLTLVFLGSVSAGPVYSFQMAKALSERTDIKLQVIISKEVDNMDAWDSAFGNNDRVDFHKIETYKHTTLDVALSLISYTKISKLVKTVKCFNPDITYFPFGCMWSSFAFPFIHRFSKIISTIHDPHPYTHGYTLSQFLLANVGFLGERFVDGSIILNNMDKQFMVEKTHKPVAVIPHAAYDFYLNEGYNVSDTIHKQITFIGRIDTYKGVDILVDAFDKVKTDGLKLLIAGLGTIDKRTLDKIKENKNIILENRFIENDEIPGFLDKSDMVILPYINATQSGVIPMAFAFGKMVIATNVGALSEQVPEGTGILTKVDATEIAHSIDNMYKNPHRIIEFGKNAKHYAETELSWSHSADLLIKFAKEICR